MQFAIGIGVSRDFGKWDCIETNGTGTMNHRTSKAWSKATILQPHHWTSQKHNPRYIKKRFLSSFFLSSHWRTELPRYIFAEWAWWRDWKGQITNHCRYESCSSAKREKENYQLQLVLQRDLFFTKNITIDTKRFEFRRGCCRDSGTLHYIGYWCLYT